VAIKLIDRGARANVRVLREELVNHRSLDGHPHIIGLKVRECCEVVSVCFPLLGLGLLAAASPQHPSSLLR
jgi:hypothetical protein